MKDGLTEFELKENEEHIIELLARYYTGEASIQERAEAEVWLAQSAENKKLGNDIQTILKKAAQAQHQFVYNTDDAWEKVKSNFEKGKVVEMSTRNAAWTWTLRIAASVLLLVSILFLVQQFTEPRLTELNLQSANTTLQDSLPDGTQVFLNKHSELVYVADKKGNQQRVQLSGEAYFSMSDNKAREFVIESAGVYVQDIGTKFNLRAYPDEEEISVMVEEGEVKFFSDTDEGIRVLAGETGYYNKAEQRFYKQEALNVNAIAYKTKVFVFNNTALAVIISSLNQVYDVPIQLTGNIQNCQVTVSFKDEAIESIADILAETLGLSIQINSDKIILEGKGCGL